MKSDLEEVIDAYELEKARLEEEMAEYIKIGDYGSAHYFQEALHLVNRKLFTLKNLDNPDFREMTALEMKISMIEAGAKRSSVNSLNFMTEMADECRRELKALQDKPVRIGLDSQEVDDALFNLVEGKLEGFDLYFKSDLKVFLSFQLLNEFIEISLVVAADEPYRHYLTYDFSFSSVGMKLEEDRWVCRYARSGFRDALEIKTMLARLIYDGFGYDNKRDVGRLELRYNRSKNY